MNLKAINDMQVLLLLLAIYGPARGPFNGIDIDRIHRVRKTKPEAVEA